MEARRNVNRKFETNSWLQCKTRIGLEIQAQLIKGVVLIMLITSVVMVPACSSKTEQGKITGAYQPLQSGMVEMYIKVELSDKTEVNALLPQDQEIWDKVTESVRRGKQLRVEIKRKGSEETWEFVRFLEE